jgi:glycosyltransferase involved in cell wall biosynthesis
MSSGVDFTIVTPSLNMLGYLKRCCASVADQAGPTFEHIVMDGGSTDGTVEWLTQNDKVVGIVQPDDGMYDAVNKGWSLARGRILSYLNCDEQYLPGTLRSVGAYLSQYPQVDILFGDALLTKPDGSLLAYRKGYQPRWFYIQSSHLYVLSCTMFIRRRVIDDGFWFDSRFREIGDQELTIRLLRCGYRARHMSRYLAAFTMTGSNSSMGPRAQQERAAFQRSGPRWTRCLRAPLNAARLLEKLLSGAYWQGMPLEYSVYTSDDLAGRKMFGAERASFRWRTG